MKAYKLFKRRKDGTIGPLFINARQVVPMSEWIPAETHHHRKGFAYRPGWHCCLQPVAPHLRTTGDDRVWALVEVTETTTYDRPESQGGAWVLAGNMRVNRLLTDAEVDLILRDKHNVDTLNNFKASLTAA